ncbi:hypothetical protein ACFQ7F_13040 [Streptomyces sp. NPDC056486]|uniref:hypothetical protein n=1 Tax=Streptomyces sp. NPDC056486 TaxID=3345835 RepID=UPI0036C5C34E
MDDFLKGFFLGALALAFSGWAVMILVGNWHAVNSAVPPIGFIDGTYVIVLATVVGSAAAGIRHALK